MTKNFRSRTAQNLPAGLLSILGISFWFWLAFPWQNSNESYSWYRALRDPSLTDFFTTNRGIVPNLRPLNQLFAYAAYKLTGGGVYLHQLFNYLVAAFACFLVCLTLKEKKLFSLTSMLVGGFLFSMYIYLFHPHGLGYSPVLLLITYLIYLFDFKQPWDLKSVISAFIATTITYLFHPAALLVFIGYLGGILIERRKDLNTKEAVLSGALLLLAATIVLLIRAHTANYGTHHQLIGFITSYRVIEVHKAVSVFLLALTLLTVASIGRLNKIRRIIIAGLSIVFAVTFYYYNLPIAIIWVITALLKMVIARKWSVVFLLVFTLPLPIGLPLGSPTYALYTIVACTLALPFGWETAERRISFVNAKTVAAVYLVALVLVISLRNGIDVPIVTSFARPLLAEKEKTYQLKKIMDWVLSSDYRDYDVVFYHDKYSPSHNPGDAVRRTNIPPTNQMYVNDYMEMMRAPLGRQGDAIGNLIVTFGDESIAGMRLLKTFDGRWAGRAMIFLPTLEEGRHPFPPVSVCAPSEDHGTN